MESSTLDGSVGTYGVILDGRTSFFFLVVGDNGDYIQTTEAMVGADGTQCAILIIFYLKKLFF